MAFKLVAESTMVLPPLPQIDGIETWDDLMWDG
jgi:hypothetical protein